MTMQVGCWGIIPAAGCGERLGLGIPKQYMELDGMTMLEYSVIRLLNDSRISGINLVVDIEAGFHVGLPILKDPKINLVQGGSERSDSVLAGLDALSDKAKESDWVLVHDAARPCVKSEEITKLIDMVTKSGIGGILAQPISDTVKRTNKDGLITKTIQRDGLWRAMTPQMFSLGCLRDALLSAKKEGFLVTDEASAMERLGHEVQVINGSPTNIKVTVPSDIEFARVFLKLSQVGPGFNKN